MGKKLTVIISMMLICTQLFAAGNRFCKIKIDLDMTVPPEADFKHGGNMSPKVVSNNRWLMIRVVYTPDHIKPAAPEMSRSGKRLNMYFSGYMDSVKMRVRVLLDTGFKVGGKTVYALFSGETVFMTVAMDGKKHLALMFIPAKLLDRYSRMADGAVRRVKKSDFKAEVVFSESRRELGRDYCNSSGRRAFEEDCRMVPDNLIIKGGVFSRLRTPWAQLGFDNFELERDCSFSEGN